MRPLTSLTQGVLLVVLAIFPPGEASAADGNAASGRVLFIRQCGLCHSVRPGEILTAPSLSGVVGRRAGTGPGYAYSRALKGLGWRWDEASLDAFLANPRGAVPGSKMSFAGQPDAVRRADLIAYLSTLK